MPKIRRISLLMLVWAAFSPVLAESWRADSARSNLSFEAVQQDAAFSGQFPNFEATIELDPNLLEAGLLIEATIDMNAVNTENEERDEYLRSEAFFDSERFPEARFSAQSVILKDGQLTAPGILTIKQQNRPVTMAFSFNPLTNRLSGSLVINRLEFNVGSGMWTDTTWVGAEVKIRVDAYLEPMASQSTSD